MGRPRPREGGVGDGDDGSRCWAAAARDACDSERGEAGAGGAQTADRAWGGVGARGSARSAIGGGSLLGRGAADESATLGPARPRSCWLTPRSTRRSWSAISPSANCNCWRPSSWPARTPPGRDRENPTPRLSEDGAAQAREAVSPRRRCGRRLIIDGYRTSDGAPPAAGTCPKAVAGGGLC